MSVDVTAVLGRQAFLSVAVKRVAGKARLRLSRRPYTHWSFAFERDPVMDFGVESQFHGRPLPQLGKRDLVCDLVSEDIFGKRFIFVYNFEGYTNNYGHFEGVIHELYIFKTVLYFL